jgi:hypothetical protein
MAGMFTLLLFFGNSIYMPASIFINENSEMLEQNSVITAKELYDAFKKDADAAANKYSNKIMTVKGFVVYTGPDVYALPSVELSENKGGKSRILCVLPFSDYFKLRKVSKGDEVFIKGEIRGFYEKGDQVLLKQCEILE